MLASEEDDLQVKLVPRVAREEVLEVALRLHDVLARSEFPAGGEAVNVGVHGEGWHAEGLRHHHRRGLVAHAGQGFERREIPRNLAAVLLDEDF